MSAPLSVAAMKVFDLIDSPAWVTSFSVGMVAKGAGLGYGAAVKALVELWEKDADPPGFVLVPSGDKWTLLPVESLPVEATAAA